MYTETFHCKKHKLRDAEGKPFESFELREVFGADEAAARSRIMNVYKGGELPATIGVDVGDAVIADAFVSVNGMPVATPFPWQNLPIRTQAFVRRAFSKINDATTKEIDDFLDGGRE